MHWFIVLALAAASFWESKAHEDWSTEELIRMRTDSPWAQGAEVPTRPEFTPVTVYLASALPMQQAEFEARRRYTAKQRAPAEDPLEEEYQAFLREDSGRHIILAVSYPDPQALSDAKETARMEQECVLKVGRKTIKSDGHFPPARTDPYLRLLFPRDLPPGAKSITFELYLPSVAGPFRSAHYELKDLVYRGKLEL